MSKADKKTNRRLIQTNPVKVSVVGEIHQVQELNQTAQRLNILKTYKLFIDGKYPRTESGRAYTLKNKTGEAIANLCRASRKDFRNAVVAARKAFPEWAGLAAYTRGQILYRMAEMLESRRETFVSELISQGETRKDAVNEVVGSIDRLVYYAGWSDKYQQVFSSVNPVSSSHFNFTVLEPTGVVALIAPENSSLLGLISALAPVVVGGNSAVVLASNQKPLCAISFAEVLGTSDLPAGVINILTGIRSELLEHFSSHLDVNAISYCGIDPGEITLVQTNAAINVKRVMLHSNQAWLEEKYASPYLILDTQEVKTTWHPIGK